MTARQSEFDDACARLDQPPRVAWTEAARARVHPRRPAPAPRLNAARAWKHVRAEHRRLDWGRSEPLAPPETSRLMAAVRESLEPEPAILGVEAEAVRAMMLGAGDPWCHRADRWEATYQMPGEPDVGASLVDLWVEANGAAFALRVLLQAGALVRLFRQEPGKTPEPWIAPRPEGRTALSSARPAWFRLRRHLAARPDDDFATARAVAEQARRQAPLDVRSSLAYLFPGETWGDEDALAWVQADRASRDSGQGSLSPHGHLLACSANAAALMERWVLNSGNQAVESYLFSLLDLLDVKAAAPLMDVLRARERATFIDEGTFLEPLVLVETSEVAEFVVSYLGDKRTREYASAFLRAAPHLGIPVLAAAARPRAQDAAAHLFVALVRAHSDLARAAAARTEGPVREALLEVLERAATDLPEAPSDRLPPVLSDPPWRRPKVRKGPKPLRLFVLAQPESIVWSEGDAHARPAWIPEPSPDRDAAALEQIRLLAAHGSMWAGELEKLTDSVAVEFWNARNAATPGAIQTDANLLLRMLTRGGLDALPGVLSFAEKELAVSVPVLARIVSPRVAPPMAEAFSRLRRQRDEARAWLVSHPDIAALGLIPAAVGSPSREQAAAAVALRMLDAEGHGHAVRGAAARYGAEASRAADALLTVDPIDALPPRLPSLPGFFDPAGLPRPRLRDAAFVLGVRAVEDLGRMLALSTLESPYAGLDQVRQACEPASVAEFAWAVFQAWLVTGADMKQQWALVALGLLGDDGTARRLTPLLRQWPAEGSHARAVLALEALAALGTDLALLQIHSVAQRARHQGIQDAAARLIVRVAEERGLTHEELEDRLVPDLGLDSDGSLTLDFGPRSFRVGFDGRLEPFVLSRDGQRLAELPKAGRTDDKPKAKAAAATWKALKADARKVGSSQALRLELAMGSRRRWSPGVFSTVLAPHPLLRHMLRRLVWGTYAADGALTGCFRVCEDGSFADVAGRGIDLPAATRIGLPHRLDLGAELTARWSAVLGSSQILQPFPQLGRTIWTPRAEEQSQTVLHRWGELTLPASRLLGLESRGWKRGRPGNSGIVSTMEKALPEGRAELSFEPGWYVGDPAEVHGRLALTWRAPRPRPFGEMPAVAFSELLLDLEALHED